MIWEKKITNEKCENRSVTYFKDDLPIKNRQTHIYTNKDKKPVDDCVTGICIF